MISHENDSNVVIVKDLVTNKTLRLNQKDLQLFVGDLETAVICMRLLVIMVIQRSVSHLIS